jgi:hypothetical protein
MKVDRLAGNGRTTYVGVVTVDVQTPNAQSGVVSVGGTALGLRIRNGFSAGLVRDHLLYVPEDCRVVFLVKTQEQLNSALNRLKVMPESVCAVQDGSLQ